MEQAIPIISDEKSIHEGQKIHLAMQVLSQCDWEYLKAALEKLREDHSWADAAMILNPNPFIHAEQQKLKGLQNKQLAILISLYENSEEIQKAKAELEQAKENLGPIQRMFGDN